MSFEDWKEEMLQRTGQDPQDLHSRKISGQRRPSDQSLSDESGAAWGDEEEIALDFGDYSTPRTNNHDADENDTDRPASEQPQDAALVYDHNKESLHRSKDAGKTCKERFSYSSFDAGATVLKTGSGTKNAKAILVENKDSYMLLECGRDNKFVIVELSDDILLDTVVIANFEFFSSMIRHFRISVSDRYPVKVDKWKELGTFEARNSRDIQAFLVENPQIWAKYVRLEFLTHYGNEYYCPVSLIRIHGSRMLDSWKEADGSREDDSAEDYCEGNACAEELETNIGGLHVDMSPENNASSSLYATPTSDPMTSMDLFAIFAATCPELPTQLIATTSTDDTATDTEPVLGIVGAAQGTSTIAQDQSRMIVTGNKTSPESLPQTVSPQALSQAGEPAGEGLGDGTDSPIAVTSPHSEQTSNATISHKAAQASAVPKHSQLSTPGSKHRATPTANAAAASPTVQEGFFNSITKRLVQVETNLTLSMKYVEDQSRHVQEAMQRMEHKQAQRITFALETLNHTVLAEMRSMRDQYEQLWHSTIVALETQREQNEQDAVALSARLNLLADEVVFQKRMAMAQAVLLLSCLFLVIFSRGVPIPYLAHANQGLDAGALNAAQGSSAVLGAQRSDRSLLDTGAPRYMRPVRLLTPDSTTHDAELDDDALLTSSCNPPDLKPDCYLQTDSQRYHQASSPNSSRTSGDENSDCQEVTSEGSGTRLAASDQHKARKPLPALPEHPLSP